MRTQEKNLFIPVTLITPTVKSQKML